MGKFGLAPWELEFPFPGSLTSTFLVGTREGFGRHQGKRGSKIWGKFRECFGSRVYGLGFGEVLERVSS